MLACAHAPARESPDGPRLGGQAAAVEAVRRESPPPLVPLPQDLALAVEGTGAAAGGESVSHGEVETSFREWAPRPEEVARVEAQRRALAEELARLAAARRARAARRSFFGRVRAAAEFLPSAGTQGAAAQDAVHLDRLLADAARRRGLDPDLVRAVARVESSLDPWAVSPKGAMGLMQLMPEAAAEVGVSDPFDPRQSAEGGTEYLRRMLDWFGGDLELALAAYNAGPGAVEGHGGVPPCAETRAYIAKVKAEYAALKRGERP